MQSVLRNRWLVLFLLLAAVGFVVVRSNSSLRGALSPSGRFHYFTPQESEAGITVVKGTYTVMSCAGRGTFPVFSDSLRAASGSLSILAHQYPRQKSASGSFAYSEKKMQDTPSLRATNTLTHFDRGSRYHVFSVERDLTFTCGEGLDLPHVCGNGFVQQGEECDDGNLINTDACTYYCKDAACRDGFLQVKGADDIAGTADDEECDDGNEFDTDFCTNACTVSCGNGIFEPMREYLVGNDPPYPITFTTLSSTVAFADINDDGYTDKVSIDFPNALGDQYHTISVHLGYGNDRYNNPTILSTGSLTPSAVAIGDLNGDGHMDLAIAHGPNNTITVFLGNGTGGFSTLRNRFPTDSKPQSIAIADLNNDGTMDMVTGNQGYYGQSGGKSVSVIFGVGMGGFAAKRNYPTTMIPQHIFVVDMNGDGNMDIVTFNIGNSVSVLLGTGQETLSEPTLYRTVRYPKSISITDLNDDGTVDIATQNLDAGVDSGIGVLLGKEPGSCDSGT